ncbi:MAG: hypothetical protein Kow0081_1200 [Candidatus Dojkabacteria bacterium]
MIKILLVKKYSGDYAKLLSEYLNNLEITHEIFPFDDVKSFRDCSNCEKEFDLAIFGYRFGVGDVLEEETLKSVGSSVGSEKVVILAAETQIPFKDIPFFNTFELQNLAYFIRHKHYENTDLGSETSKLQ